MSVAALQAFESSYHIVTSVITTPRYTGRIMMGLHNLYSVYMTRIQVRQSYDIHTQITFHAFSVWFVLWTVIMSCTYALNQQRARIAHAYFS